MVLDVLADGLAGYFLHRPMLKLGAPPQCISLVVGQSQCHRHVDDGIMGDTIGIDDLGGSRA